jgi:tetratricopeptide (TPR) repeat protein
MGAVALIKYSFYFGCKTLGPYMEETQLTQDAGSTGSKGCVNCGSDYVVEKYPTRLCSDCRQLFIKYPIPLAVKIFAIGVGLVLLFALFSFPQNLSTGIHFEKARQYEQKKQFVSAQREYTSVVQQAPDNLEANAHLMIAAFYNLDYLAFINAADHLSGKNFDDKALYDQLDEMVNRVQAQTADSNMSDIMAKYNNEIEVPDSDYVNYLKVHPFHVYALYTYATRLYQRKDFAGCDSLLQRLLGVDTEDLLALRMLAAVAREKGQWEESIKYCEKIIQLNSEAAYAYAAMARTYLKWNKLAKGLELAKKSAALDKKDPYNLVTLALAWHFNKQPVKRDEVMKEMKLHTDSATLGHIQYAMDVINNKESL